MSLQHGGVALSTVAGQQESSDLETFFKPLCVEFASSPNACVGFL